MSEYSYETPSYEQPSGSKTGMILGIIGIVIGVLGLCAGIACAGLGYFMVVVALTLGIIALVVAKNDANPQQAKTLGIVAIVLAVLVLIISCANSAIGIWMTQTGQMDSIFENILRDLQ